MKRFLILGALTVAFAAASYEQASAWINSNFGLGMNWSWQSGGNSILGGLWRDGQPCGPDFVPTHQPVYSNRPCCCQANVVQQVAPQVVCTPGCNGGPGGPGFAPGGPGFAPGGPGFAPGVGGPGFAPAPVAAPAAAPAQAFRYSYRPSYYYGYGR